MLCALHVSCSVCLTELSLCKGLSFVWPLLLVYMQVDDSSVKSHGLKIWSGSVLLAVWLAVLIVTVVLGSTLANPPPPLLWWQVFYRTGGEQGHQQGLAVLMLSEQHHHLTLLAWWYVPPAAFWRGCFHVGCPGGFSHASTT